MICPNCNTNLPDDATVCTTCNTEFAPALPTVPVKKLKYLKTLASKKVKTLNIVSWIVCLVCIALLSVGMIQSYTQPFYQIAIIQTLVPEEAAEFKDSWSQMQDDFKEATQELEKVEKEYEALKEKYADNKEVLAQMEKEFSENIDMAEYNKMQSMFEKGTVFFENPSIQNTQQLLNHVEEDFLIELLGESYADLPQMINIAVYGIFAFFTFIILLTVLITIFKKTVLTVFVQFLAVIFAFIFAGPIPTIIIAITYIVLAVFFRITNKEYKAYRKSTLA